jgi:predicted nuclease of predicted toxin-antitoxin system
MKIKLDENLPGGLKEALAGLGHEVDTVQDEGLSGEADPQVWQAAQKDGRFLITLDVYFTDIRQHVPGQHHGVLLLRLPVADRDQVIGRVLEIFRGFDVGSWSGLNVVATKEVVRMRKP